MTIGDVTVSIAILCYLHLDPRWYIPPKQAIYFSRKPLTYPDSASVQYGLHGGT